VHPLSGRTIAPVMSFHGASWLERSARHLEEDPERAIELLNLKPGMMVADVGAGSGYFTRRMAPQIVPGGKVYANDIQPEMLELLRKNLKRDGISNVVPVLGTEDDPKLPAATFDLILMVDVYHELAKPQQILQRLRRSLKDNGRLVLIEYRKEDPSIPIRPDHKMSIAEAKAELEPEGYRLETVLHDLPRQHVLVFRKLSM
jgi:ubiquinone/menaquinone biosynthesis C-methylase UbiE